MKVAIHVGQLQQPIPGGIGRYVRSMLRELPAQGVTPIAFAAGAKPRGITGEYIDLGWPNGSMRYEAWHRWQRPRVRIATDLVLAPSLAIPPVLTTPLVVTAHDIAFHRFPANTTRRGRKFHERGLQLAKENAKLVLAPSDFTRRELISIGFAADKVRTAYLGADPADTVRSEVVADLLRRMSCEDPFILTVGTVEPRKRLGLLVEAHQRLRKTFPSVELIIVGPQGWGDVGQLERTGVRRVGALPWPYLDALYRGATVCALPSVYEGFGLPAVEAMNRGCPVVVADGSALEEVVGDAGAVVPADDLDALTTALQHLFENDDQRKTMRDAGRLRAAQFTWAESARQHSDIFQSLLAN